MPKKDYLQWVLIRKVLSIENLPYIINLEDLNNSNDKADNLLENKKISMRDTYVSLDKVKDNVTR